MKPVRFNGGPFDGIQDSKSAARIAVGTANQLHEDYQTTPPAPGVGWWFWIGMPKFTGDGIEGEAHYYRIDPQLNGEGQIVCEYGGTEHPTDHTHDD